jgi:hypothetical protein
LFLQLKCTHFVPAKAPLPEKAIFKQNQAATEKWRAAHKAEHKVQEITKRNRNDNRIKWRKAGSTTPPPMKIHHRRERGVEMSLVSQLIGVTFQGRPRPRHLKQWK